jgi:predicted RNA binding protein YcfA (HicA-like mRNA interferase family)
LKSARLIKVIKQDGWKLVPTKGSHHHFKHPTKKGIVTIPHPNSDVPKGTVANILRQAGL